jgi:hypothetical protein
MKVAFLGHPLARRGLIAALAVVTAAGVVAGRERPALEVIEARPAQTEKRAAALPEIDLERLKRAEAPPPQADPFAPRSFAPPPQAVVARAAAPEAPSAPPLPFTYIGRLIQDGKTEVFVVRGDELISIAAGQNIDAQYRVDAISEARIAFTYLPLRTRQSLELPEAPG